MPRAKEIFPNDVLGKLPWVRQP
jgi:hypothetical protein